MHVQGKFLSWLLGTWFLRTTVRKSQGKSVPLLTTSIHAHKRHTTGKFFATYKVVKIKPNVFVYFVLVAFPGI